ncbi:hypothetical protein [Rhizosaccharibacter radicis]|uniref:Uncharacterized protein n=1 Tax=Rhizosaccharibacter radicis TaxID=2782605 RepID=A0ABT1VUQ7_9PROT|nr:hypothetical protein [Acetobacteraceae bacterium KSS12]
MSEPPSLFPHQPVVRRLPWEIHPSLREERLKLCARMLADARRDAVALRRADLGDDGWSVGCRAYAFGRKRLRQAADEKRYSWLSIRDSSNRFIFRIGEVDVRFFRGSADEPTRRTLRRHGEEARQIALPLHADVTAGLVFRFALEADEAGDIERVVFLALHGEDGHAECFWPIPLDAAPVRRAAAGRQLTLLGDEGLASDWYRLDPEAPPDT